MEERYLTVIEPKGAGFSVNLNEIWRYRELLKTFFWRELKVRYKQTFIGAGWVVLQPLISMIIFTFVFGRIVRISSGGLPYSLFSLSGLIFWTFFTSSLTRAGSSMIEHQNLIRKAYFPRIILPLSDILTGLVDFSINFIFLMIYAYVLRFIPSAWILVVIPGGIMMTVLAATGLGSFFASVNVKYRDVRYALPFFVQIMMYATPIIYPLSAVSPRIKFIMALNPATSVIEMTRWLFSGGKFIDLRLLAISMISSIAIFVVGIWYFNKTQRYFADVI